MKSSVTTTCEITLARPLAPEEVRCGQYVTILDEIVEWPSFMWCNAEAAGRPQDLIRMKIKSSEGGIPLRVKSICLPFVSVQTHLQQIQVLDLRRVQLVRLSREFGKSVWKALAKQAQPVIPGPW
ncbi:hypothetical protein SH661x_001578 [Planctomicrobium sp. SH661]|uniref:hypothetical protein n=1 Tax=Planctomicrobium sp. SH661 TaxID=3448124 RepID=UPI003F5B0E9B